MKSKLIYLWLLLCGISCTVIVSCAKKIEPSASMSEQATPTIDICATNESYPISTPDFQDIQSTLAEFFTEENPQELVDAYKTSILDTQIEHWEGWVQDMDQIWQRKPVILVDMDEFAGDVEFPVFKYQEVRRTGLPDVILTNVPSEIWESATEGHKLTFSGVIKDLTPTHFHFNIDPTSGTVAIIIEMSNEPEKNQLTDPLCSPDAIQETVITLTEPVCSFAPEAVIEDCYTIGITIFGDGLVVRSRRYWVSGETQISHVMIQESAVNSLIDLANQFGYFSWQDDYDSENITHYGSTTTSITFGDTRKSIFHYHGDTSAPAELDTFENAIMQAVGVYG